MPLARKLTLLAALALPLAAAALVAGSAAASAPAGTAATPPPAASGEILFVSARDGDRELYVMDADGRNVRQLTRNRLADITPAWSPDGRRIAFARSTHVQRASLYVMNADGTRVRRLTSPRASRGGLPLDESPTWSPDGRRLAFVSLRAGERRLYVVNADGSGLRLLTPTPRRVSSWAPAWSPDGRWIAFASDRASLHNANLYLVRPDGSGLRRLTRTPGDAERQGDDSMPAWSPDGRRIAFVSNRTRGSQLWTIGADGRNQRRLARSGRDDVQPSWSPDGAWIAASSELRRPNPRATIVRMRSSGSGRIVLGRGEYPRWRPAMRTGAAAQTGSSLAATSSLVYFTRGEHFSAVRRSVRAEDRLAGALAALASGPTEDEHRRGVRTSVPPGTRFLGVHVRGGVAVVDVSRQFARGTPGSVRTRLAQLVFTATEAKGVTAVRVALEGRLVREIKRVAVDPPLRRSDFRPPPFGGRPALPPPQGPRSAALRRLQLRLTALGYLARGAATGRRDERTRTAVLAFQKWEGLTRDGIVGPQTRARLAVAKTPLATRASARYIEVSLRRQVALLVEQGRVLRVIHVSTGAAASPTPRGSYRVFRKELRSWSIPFRQWLPYASYFTGGIAFHEYADVPAYPASHGCVRVPAHEAQLVYRFARLGTRVIVS